MKRVLLGMKQQVKRNHVFSLFYDFSDFVGLTSVFFMLFHMFCFRESRYEGMLHTFYSN